MKNFFFDFFDEANAQFKKEVGKAWDELVEDLSGGSSSSSSSPVSDILKSFSYCPDSPSNGGFTGMKNPLEQLKDCERAIRGIRSLIDNKTPCAEPVAGTPVYCKLS